VTLLLSLASVSLIITPLIILLLFAAPFLERKYTAGGRYLMWILVMGCLCLPFASFIPRPAVQIHVPVPAAASSYDIRRINNTAGLAGDGSRRDGGETVSRGVPVLSAEPARESINPSSANLFDVIRIVWFAGIFLSVAYHAANHLMFKRFVRRWGMPEPDPGYLQIFNETARRMGIVRALGLKRCKGIKTPMLMGFIKPAVLLPDLSCDEEDLRFIFRHELTHYKRRDLWYKLALMITISIHWFNPAVHLMIKQANKDIETICDTLTVHGMDMGLRKKYSEMLLTSCVGRRVCRSRLTTNFIGGKRMLKQRFLNILGKKAKKKRQGAVWADRGGCRLRRAFDRL